MKVLLPLFAFVVLLCVEPLKCQERESANELVDTSLRLIRKKYKPPMKPLAMSNRTLGIDEQVGFLHMRAVVFIKKGFVNQIGNISRVGQAFYTESEDESTLIEMKIALEDIKFNASIEIEVMGIRQNQEVEGGVGIIGVRFEVFTNGTTGQRSVQNVKIFDMDGLDLELFGPNDIVNRFQNIPIRIGLRVVMRTNLKRIVHAITSIAVADAISRIAGGV